jgi:hypothetical protein
MAARYREMSGDCKTIVRRLKSGFPSLAREFEIMRDAWESAAKMAEEFDKKKVPDPVKSAQEREKPPTSSTINSLLHALIVLTEPETFKGEGDDDPGITNE